ncbi:MAG: DNA-3-methyladenine glycosylase [Nitrososphaerales archaeon]|jgi:DNA-3-methyladenine glycosylase
MSTVLGRNFYSRSPVLVARELVGMSLVRRLEGRKMEGIIVETEAYGGSRDPASHAYRGRTKRNEVMFGEAGHAYVYFTYGFHHCLNFVTGRKGVASAVLIRALEPTRGIEAMAEFRKTSKPTELTSGPGKICQALAIDRSLNGIDVTSARSSIYVLNGVKKTSLKVSERIGINAGKERKWRFFAEDTENVSRRK